MAKAVALGLASLVPFASAGAVQVEHLVDEHLGGGEQAVAEGRVLTHDQAKARLARWLK